MILLQTGGKPDFVNENLVRPMNSSVTSTSSLSVSRMGIKVDSIQITFFLPAIMKCRLCLSAQQYGNVVSASQLRVVIDIEGLLSQFTIRL